MNRKRHNTAFTLIELLVALAMVAAIVSMVYGSYAATVGSLEIYDSRMNCSQRAQLALRLMARQLRCAYAPAEPNEADSGPEQTGPSPSAATRQTLAQKPPSVFSGDGRDGRGDLLAFITTAGLGSTAAAPQRLSYTRYRYDRTNQTLFIDRGTSVNPFGDSDNAPQWQRLLDNVQAIDLAFYDGRQWRQQWDYAREKGLPRAVRVDLTVADERDRQYHLGTTAWIGYRVSAPPQTSTRGSRQQ